MRLLDITASFTVREFTDGEIPKYAILSHTWGKEEVTLQDMQSGTARLKKGYSKIEGCSRQAARDGWDYIWVDTCCIDKTSSQELSEAINSMYIWYGNAEVCYAYLEDVSTWKIPNPLGFCNSKWFTRGWTLQELIAPRNVKFYASNWHEIGSKTHPYLESLISKTTGIDSKVLIDGVLKGISVSQRMLWAAQRKTTRSEDRAYSLMGLFDVNMPLLYGEGGIKSFMRLQEEIMKGSDDQSLFAWTEEEEDKISPYRGLLARSPVLFSRSHGILLGDSRNNGQPYSMTNKGLHIELLLVPSDITDDVYLAVLECKLHKPFSSSLVIYLKCISAEGNQFCRIKPNTIKAVFHNHDFYLSKLSHVYIRQSPLILNPDNLERPYYIQFPMTLDRVSYHSVYPRKCYTMRLGTFAFWANEEASILYDIHGVSQQLGITILFTPAGHCLFKLMALNKRITRLDAYLPSNSQLWTSWYWNGINSVFMDTEEGRVYAKVNVEREHRSKNYILALECSITQRNLTPPALE